MTTKTDADVFHAWAVGEGLFAENISLPAAVTAAEVATISPTADPARDILRKKGIQQIFFNDATQVITVLTRKVKPTKKEAALLPKTVGESSIEYRQGVVDDVGGMVPKSHGKPFHIVLRPDGDCLCVWQFHFVGQLPGRWDFWCACQRHWRCSLWP